MTVRFTYLKFPSDAEAIEKAKSVYINETAPAIRAFPGNVQVMLLEPENDQDEFISFSLWKDADALAAFEASPDYKPVMARIKEVVLSAHPKVFHAENLS